MKMKRDSKPLIIGIAIILILIILVFVTNKKNNDTDTYEGMTDEEIEVTVKESVNEMKKNDLGGMGERDRIEYYISSFITSIENKQYEEAYEMLYEDFKKNYFPTFDKFKEYASTKFPTEISLNYTNIERNGTVYIVWADLSNPLGSKDSKIEMNFVVQENDLNDFDMSFKVI